MGLRAPHLGGVCAEMGKAAAGCSADSAVCAVMRAETKPGLDEEFEALMRDLAFQVRSEEPGCAAYVVTRTLGSRNHFAIHARFEDMAAFNGHAQTSHLLAAMPRLTALLTAPVSMEIFFAV
jgi:quinol monooxygenase YgiN